MDTHLTLEYLVHTIEMRQYIAEYMDKVRIRGYCATCRRHGKQWVCPPFDYDTDALLSQYRRMHIIGTKVTLSEEIRHQARSPQEAWTLSDCIMAHTRRLIDPQLLSLEHRYAPSFLFYAGSCHICKSGECTRVHDRPCLYPDRSRPSLEAFGFDISKSCDELLSTPILWGHGSILPPYYLFVSALASDSHGIEFP